MKMTEQEKRKKLSKLISDLGNLDIIMLHNEYCSAAKYYDDEIFPMDLFDELMAGRTPSEVAEMVYNTDFNPRRAFFVFSIYGVKSFDFWDDENSPVYLSDMTDYILRYDDELGNDDVRDFLDELNEDEDEDEGSDEE